MKTMNHQTLDVMIPGLRPDSRLPEHQTRESGWNTVAAKKTPLPAYHPLLDVHLKHQWRKPEVKRHLKQVGFYNEKGELVDPNGTRARICAVRTELTHVDKMLKAKQVQKDLRTHDRNTKLQRQHVIELKMQRISAQREAFQSNNRAKKALTDSVMSRMTATGSTASSTGRLPDVGNRLPSSRRVTKNHLRPVSSKSEVSDLGDDDADGIATDDTGNFLNLPFDRSLDSNHSLPSSRRGSKNNQRPGSSKSEGSADSGHRRKSLRPGHESVATESRIVRRTGLQRRHSSMGASTGGSGPMASQGRRSSTMEMRRKSLSAQSSLALPDDVDEEDMTLEDQLKKVRQTDLWTLSKQLDIPLGLLKEAVGLFKKHARLSSGLKESIRTLQGQDLLKHGRISNGKASDLLHQAASSSTCQNAQRQVDFNEFAIRYWSRSFAEDAILSDDQMEMREIARIHGISYADIEKYKHRYVEFDTDGSGMIEIDEFEALLIKLTKIPAGMELPQTRIQTLWRMCTHNHECNFEQFAIFYHTYFSEGAADPFSDFYHKATGRPM